MDVPVLVNQLLPIMTAEIAKLWNFIFEYKNHDYEPVGPEWIGENLTLPALKRVAQAVTELNGLKGLTDLFLKRVGEAATVGLGGLASPAVTRAQRRRPKRKD